MNGKGDEVSDLGNYVAEIGQKVLALDLILSVVLPL